MCVPGCQKSIVQRLSRRNFLKIGATAFGAVAVTGCSSTSSPEGESNNGGAADSEAKRSFSQVVDLTHTLTPNFPTFGGESQLELEALATIEADGYNMYRWSIVEHTGTHMDAPIHFSDQESADLIPVANLVLPLAVVDIRAKAEENADAQLTPDDLKAWEEKHGRLPERACVAMLSGWDAYVTGDKFRNADESGAMHFPGFHVEAIDFLLEERNALAIVVDTLSLDYGPSPDFAVHYKWLPTNRWGMECVANLGDVPAVGATIVAGGPKIAGATGGPSRVLALV